MFWEDYRWYMDNGCYTDKSVFRENLIQDELITDLYDQTVKVEVGITKLSKEIVVVLN